MPGVSGKGKDSTFGTLLRALLICAICSVAVTLVVVALRSQQDANKLNDKLRSALNAAQVEITDGANVSEVFTETMNANMVDLDTGEFVPEAKLQQLGIQIGEYNFVDAANSAQLGQAIEPDGDPARIQSRAKYMPVYTLTSGEYEGGIVLPVYGKGLWSTLYGFLALEKDGKTIISLKFYDQKETPGLGGRIGDDTKWLDTWQGKVAYKPDGSVGIRLEKNKAAFAANEQQYLVDSLSGATLTSNGVTNLLLYWLGEDGYKSFLTKQYGGLAALPVDAEELSDSTPAIELTPVMVTAEEATNG